MGADRGPELPLVLLGDDLDAPHVVRVAGGTAVLYTHRSPLKGGDAGNEDAAAALAYGDEAGALIVADGVGGHAVGDQASAGATQALCTAITEAGAAETDARRDLRDVVLDGFELANAAVSALPGGAATTLLVAELRDGSVRIHHAGDSQALVTGQRGRVKHQTTPHSPVGYAVEAGLLDEEAAMVHEDRHLVSNALGAADMHIEIGSPIPLAPRDTILLASDGLFDNLPLDEIVEIVRRGPLLRAVERLVHGARARMTGDAAPGKPDDLTVIAWRPGPVR